MPGPDGRPWHGWRVLLLPFLDGQELYKRYDFRQPWDGPNNRGLANQMPRTYAFSDSNRDGERVANYLAVVGPETMWPGAARRREFPKDGMGTTLLLVENHGLNVPWMEPRDLDFRTMSFDWQHPNGISSRYTLPAGVMVDGSLRTFGPTLTPDVLRALLTADGGEKLADTADGWGVIEDGRDREVR